MKTTYMLRVTGDIRPGIADVAWWDSVGAFVIHRINIPAPARGNGYGSQLLKQITNDADTEGVRLMLAPEPSGGLDYELLVKWYQRHGFLHTRSGAMMERMPG